MKFIVTIVLCFTGGFLHAQYGPGSDPYSNSNSIKKQSESCQQKLSDLQSKMNQRSAEYKRDEKEFLNGEFCSDCKESKSQIEKSRGISFAKHIQDGASGGRRVMRPTQEMMDQLYQKYLSDFNRLKGNYESTSNNCSELNNRYNNARNEDYQNIQKTQQDEASRKKQEHADKLKAQQDEAKRQNQERLQQLQDEYRARLEEQRIQALKEQAAQNEMSAKMNANTQEAEDKTNSYMQQTELGNNYTDRSSDARMLLDPSRAASESEVFGSVLRDMGYQTMNNEERSFVNRITDAMQGYRQSLRENISNFSSSLFGNSLNVSESDEMPSSGFFDNVRQRINSTVTKVQSAFSNVRSTYREEIDMYNEGRELYDQMQPKTFASYLNTNYENAIGLLNSTFDDFNNGTDNSDNNFQKYYRRLSANTVGGLMGRFLRLPFATRNDVQNVMDNN